MKVARHVLPLTVVLLALPAAAGAQSASQLPGDLGDVVVGARSPVVYVPVTAMTGATFATTPPQPTGPDAGQFTLPVNTCAGATLPAGASCFVGVRFAPTSTGLKTASVVLT